MGSVRRSSISRRRTAKNAPSGPAAVGASPPRSLGCARASGARARIERAPCGAGDLRSRGKYRPRRSDGRVRASCGFLLLCGSRSLSPGSLPAPRRRRPWRRSLRVQRLRGASRRSRLVEQLADGPRLVASRACLRSRRGAPYPEADGRAHAQDVLKAISELDAKVGRKVDELRTEMKKGFADLDKELTGHTQCTADREGHRRPEGQTGEDRGESTATAADAVGTSRSLGRLVAKSVTSDR